MQPRFFGEQQHCDRRQRCREAELAETGEDAGADHDERRDFRGRVDIVLAGADVARDNERERAGDEQRRGNWQAGLS